MSRVRTLLTGVGAGAGLMYWFDPDRGTRRRAIARDKVLHIVREEREIAEKGLRDLEHRRQGVVYRLKSAFRNSSAPDDVLAERVRATLGRHSSHPGAIDVTVRNGCVTLCGAILTAEAEMFVIAVRAVPGIQGVDDRLERHEHAGDVPRLQGPGHPMPRKRRLVGAEHWVPAVRLVAGGAGLVTGVGGLARGGRIGRMATALGSLVMLRAAANMPLKRLFGLGERPDITVAKTVMVAAPVETVYSYVRNFENMACFMDHVEEVRVHDAHSTWVVRGPVMRTIRFEVEITHDAPNQLISWRSTPGQLIDHTGTVRFERVGDCTTRMSIHLSYSPPAGHLGYLIASLFRVDPKHALDDDMVRFKSIIERGKTRAHGHDVRREQLRPA